MTRDADPSGTTATVRGSNTFRSSMQEPLKLCHRGRRAGARSVIRMQLLVLVSHTGVQPIGIVVAKDETDRKTDFFLEIKILFTHTLARVPPHPFEEQGTPTIK